MRQFLRLKLIQILKVKNSLLLNNEIAWNICPSIIDDNQEELLKTLKSIGRKLCDKYAKSCDQRFSNSVEDEDKDKRIFSEHVLKFDN